MTIILFDHFDDWQHQLPLTLTRPVANLRVGHYTIDEKWARVLGVPCSYLCEDYLSELFPPDYSDDNLYVRSSLLPGLGMAHQLKSLQYEQALMSDDGLLAFRSASKLSLQELRELSNVNFIHFSDEYQLCDRPWKIYQWNGDQIRFDVSLGDFDHLSEEDQLGNTIIEPAHVYLGKGVKMRAAIINAENGPVILDDYTEIQEGAIIRGPFAAGKHAVVNMGAKIRGDSTIGPYVKVGGEVSNSVIWGYSNKGHDGFIGNTVIGAWCNLGADTNTSNLKNTYGDISLYSYATQKMEDTSLQFCGTVMGDHVKTSINTMLNSGTSIGVGSNIFGSGFPPKFIPSFAWGEGGPASMDWQKFLLIAERTMSRRHADLTPALIRMYQHIYNTL